MSTDQSIEAACGEDSPTRGTRAAKAIAALLVAAYAVYFTVFTCTSHALLHTYAYDLGTFDQGVWLAGHTSDPFITVRGLPLLGDHVRFFAYVLAPLYWIVDDVRALLAAQSVSIALGAWFVLRIAMRELAGRPWTALAFAAAWLLHPANQNLNLDHAHPDAFATTFILASVDALRGGRTVVFAVAAALAMSCKEDVPLVFVAMGVAMMLDPARRRFGATLAAMAGMYFALCMFLILPHYNGIGFFRFGNRGFLYGVGRNAGSPLWFLHRLVSADSLGYLARVSAPLAGLFVLAPLTIVPALPPLITNLLSDANYMRSYDYHYMTSIVPFLMVAAIDGAALLGRRVPRMPGLPSLAALLVLGAVVATNVAWSRSPLSQPLLLRDRLDAVEGSRTLPVIRTALSRIPRDAVVSAHYSMVPQFSHRRGIYLFPNPFTPSNWGIAEEKTHDPSDVEYVVLRNITGRDQAIETFEGMAASQDFERIDGDRDFALYRRRSLMPPSPAATCGDWNADGKVSTDDVRSIADAILRKTGCPMFICDTDGDGSLSSSDALRLHKKSRGESVPLDCPH